MNEITTILLTGVLGGGLIKAGVDLVRYLRERKQNTADATAAGITAPAEAESMQVKALVLAMQSLSEQNQKFHDRLKDADREREADRADRKSMHREISGLRRALEAAQDYIEAWIAWGHRVAPNEPQPKPPPNYRNF